MKSLSFMPLALLAGLLVLLDAPVRVTAADGHCESPPCGRVDNQTPWEMYWGYWSPYGMEYKCDVYNWHDDYYTYANSWAEKWVYCNWYTVDPYYATGGYYYDGYDVDFFCYYDRKYWVHFDDGHKYYLEPNVWTKYPKTKRATCKNENGEPHCYIAVGA